MTVVFGSVWRGPSYRRLTVALLVAVVGAGLTLLAIAARSPYTHANLGGIDPHYERTAQIVVGADTAFAGVSPDARAVGADAAARGAVLYVTRGCAGCHALEARGGPVGPRIAGIDQETIAARVRQGPVGMPRFSTAGLTEDEIAEIAAYLRSLGTD